MNVKAFRVIEGDRVTPERDTTTANLIEDVRKLARKLEALGGRTEAATMAMAALLVDEAPDDLKRNVLAQAIIDIDEECAEKKASMVAKRNSNIVVALAIATVVTMVAVLYFTLPGVVDFLVARQGFSMFLIVVASCIFLAFGE